MAGATLARSRNGSSGDEDNISLKRGCGALVVASVIACVGAAAWVFVIIKSGYEVGLLAWIIGAAIGAGARIARGAGGFTPALYSAILALVAIGGVKLLIVAALPAHERAGLFTPFDFLWLGLALVSAYRLAARE